MKFPSPIPSRLGVVLNPGRLLAYWMFFLLAACGGPEGPTHIRLINRSGVPLEDVVVEFPTTSEEYGTIMPGRATSYRLVDQAYGYAYLEATIEGRPAVLQPIDYVGERLLGPGHFAYVLTYDPSAPSEHGRLRLELIRE